MNKTLHQVGESPRPIFRKQALQEGAARILFTLTACISILAVVLICVFLFANGIPGMAKIGVWDFLSAADNTLYEQKKEQKGKVRFYQGEGKYL